MIYKIDVDIKGRRTWKRYSKWLEFALLRLKEGGKTFSHADVFRTRHGFHIYIEDHHVANQEVYTNLIECLLGSDINKQLYFYAEKSDILFKKKNGFKEQRDAKKTKQINALIVKARGWNKYQRIVVR